MGTPASLQSLFRYHAWANDELLDKLEGLDPERHAQARHEALRLLNHVLVVSLIFAGHLTRQPHGFTADNTPDTPTLEVLADALRTSDRWYLDHLQTLTEEALTQSWPFVFTDGDCGYMTREEMLMHVIVHSTYHRGEVGRILRLAGAPLPWDTFAVYLHASDPERRSVQVGSAEPAS